jgi:hypothetical protein
MLKISIISLCCILAFHNTTKAQALQNTTWKSFFDAPINDTATLSIGTDSLFISNSHGMALDVAVIKISGDTLEINDVSGPIKCASDDKGVYSYAITNGKLVLTIISDDCDGRANAISGRQWMVANKQ